MCFYFLLLHVYAGALAGLRREAPPAETVLGIWRRYINASTDVHFDMYTELAEALLRGGAKNRSHANRGLDSGRLAACEAILEKLVKCLQVYNPERIGMEWCITCINGVPRVCIVFPRPYMSTTHRTDLLLHSPWRLPLYNSHVHTHICRRTRGGVVRTYRRLSCSLLPSSRA
jgi:hypothetical protein